MPEGPELCMNSRFVNSVCSGRLFAGKVVKSHVSKCSDVDFVSDSYTITSESRGKELALTLQCTLEPLNKLRLLFRFGMSGKFRFCPREEIPKHAHLQFFSESQPVRVLSFVDARRFGSWHVAPEGWGENRGPDPIFDYDAFRCNVLQNMDDIAFNRPICEALLNQKYFNGIGNYLRAEVLFRVGIPPFTCARKVIKPLLEKTGECDGEEGEDILWLCHKLPQEVINLKNKFGEADTSALTEGHHAAFCQWLRCYENPSVNTAKDSTGRTIWFKGEAGAMCHRAEKPRRRARARRGRQRAPDGSVPEDDCKREDGESVDVATNGRTRRRSVKQEGRTVVIKKEPNDNDSYEDGVGAPNKQSTKRKRQTAVNKELVGQIKTEPPVKRTRVSVTTTSGKERVAPARRSSRIKAQIAQLKRTQ